MKLEWYIAAQSYLIEEHCAILMFYIKKRTFSFSSYQIVMAISTKSLLRCFER